MLIVKMKPLVTIHRVLTVLCILPFDEDTNKWKKLIYIAITITVIASNMAGFAASSTLFLKYLSSDFESSLHALLQMCAQTAATYMLVIGFISRHKIKSIFVSLAKIYDASANSDSFQFMEFANNRSEYMSQMYLKFVLVGFFVNTLAMSVVSLVFCWMMNGDFDAEFVYHPFRVLVPWNVQTFAGYSGEICFDITFGETYLFSNCSLLLLFISICLHQREFSRRISYSLQKLEFHVPMRNNKRFLCEIINFHKSVKKWSWESADVYSRFIMIQLINNTVFLACVAFQLDLQFQHFGFGIIIILISVMVGVSNLFLYCYFGRLSTESFAAMSNSIYEANWKDLHVDLQKYFILMIGNAQRPFFYHGFGIAILNLETFSKMVKMVFTYYMLLKTITSK